MESVHDDSIAIEGFEFIVTHAQVRVEVKNICSECISNAVHV